MIHLSASLSLEPMIYMRGAGGGVGGGAGGAAVGGAGGAAGAGAAGGVGGAAGGAYEKTRRPSTWTRTSSSTRAFREEQRDTCRGGQTTLKAKIYLGDFGLVSQSMS